MQNVVDSFAWPFGLSLFPQMEMYFPSSPTAKTGKIDLRSCRYKNLPSSYRAELVTSEITLSSPKKQSPYCTRLYKNSIGFV